MRHLAKARSDKEKKEIYDKWHKLINMSQKALDDWAENEDRLLASINRSEAKDDHGGIQSGYDSFHRIKRRKGKKFEDWTAQDFDNASQENGFNGRMLGGEPGDPVGDSGRSKWEISLRNWGHDPSLQSSPAHAKYKAWKEKHSKKASMSKNACIIGAGQYSGSNCLIKVRDRNYVPAIKIIREIVDGVEVAYLYDIDTDWSEGINEYGIGVVSSALRVIDDEVVKKEKAKADDGIRIRKILAKDNISSAVNEAVRNGMSGHCFISDANQIVTFEPQPEDENHWVKLLDLAKGDIAVRTNHGVDTKGTGYTKGPDFVSSKYRHQQAVRWLNQCRDKNELARSLTRRRLSDYKNPNNMIRDLDDGMMTTSLAVLDSEECCMKTYLIPSKVDFCGIENRLPEGYKPKVKLEFYEYYNWNRKAPSLRQLDNKDLTSLRVFVYGSLMKDIPHQDLLLSVEKATVKSMRRSFNRVSDRRGHMVCGTRPSGSMQGLILKYPMSEATKVLNTIDRREGYQADREEEINSYLRTPVRAYSSKHPEGVRCVIYITNEESKSYTGEYTCKELAPQLNKGKGLRYLKDIAEALEEHGCEDPYISQLLTQALATR